MRFFLSLPWISLSFKFKTLENFPNFYKEQVLFILVSLFFSVYHSVTILKMIY